MLKLKKIKSDASWGEVVDAINGNNSAINTEAETLKFANVDWGEEVAFPIVDGSDLVPDATLQHNTCYLFGEVEELNITLDSDASDFVKVYMFQFHSGATPTKLSVPSEVKWANAPIIRANRVYQVTIIDGYATYREFLFNTAEIPTTEIWYTSLDGNVVEPYSKTVFGADYDSSTYGKGKGIMTFTGEVTTIGTDAFRYKTTLTSAIPPSSVKEIGNNAFRGCTALAKIHIPRAATKFGESVFSGCVALTSIDTPGVTSFGSWTFNGCTSLARVQLSDDMDTMAYGMFRNCSALEKISIPKGVQAISEQAFYGCSSLKEVTLPDVVLSLGASCFRGTAIERIELPDSITSMGSHIFQIGSSVNATLVSANIPLGVKVIPDAVFQNQPLSDPKGIRIHSGITKIGSFVFSSNKIPRIYIDDLSAWCKIDLDSSSATPVGTEIKEIYINGESVSSIVTPTDIDGLKQYVFYRWNMLTDVTITSNVTAIGNQAFRYCTSLQSVTFESTTPPTLGTDVFTNTNASLQLRVPSSAVETYKAAYPDYADKIVGY